VTRIYLSPPDVGQDEQEMLSAALASKWVAPVGPDLDAFEGEVAQRVGVPHAVAVSSGSAALHLALVVLGVTQGDEVLVPTLTFAATANAVSYVGAHPVFVDCDTSTWQVSPELVALELQRRARQGRLPAAVVSVDLYGQSADYAPLTELCAEYDVPLIEDAAEALGATYRGREAGSFGSVGVLSFNGNKIITTSGGGMILTTSEELSGRARYLATQAREPLPHYEHLEIGYNYRLSNLLAALGRAQLRRLDQLIARRRHVNEAYRSSLSSIPGISFMPIADYGVPNYWLSCLLIDPAEFGATRDDVRVFLEKQDIESRPTWKPLHLQPVFSGCDVVGGENAARIFERGLCLPSGSTLEDSDIERIIDLVSSSAS